MDPQSAKRSVRLEDLSVIYPSALNFSTDREADRAHTSRQSAGENRPLLSMPSGLKGMLKNTTETGDIGQFPIISSRHPYSGRAKQWNPRGKSTATSSEAILANTIQEYRPNNRPQGIDDRRRLPSYARDVMSDTASLYEPASQSCVSRSQITGISEARSCSMTQTSANSDLQLANHKSYSSLRIQLEIGQPQRPRSPFVYPKRLKRPGFRPLSPVLLPGRNYCRPAEIDRLPNVSGKKTPSPSSLYANPKVPTPSSIRSDVNRSTPSFGFSSSPRRPSVSPRAKTSEYVQECTSRNNTPGRPSWSSPARSYSSLASGANLYSQGQLGSTASTPGKRLPPSPLYYDYTEDFEGEDTSIQNRAPAENLLPPPFLIERTIHEDRELSSEWSSPSRSEKRESNRGHGRYSSQDRQVTTYDTIDERDIFEVFMLGSELLTASPLSTPNHKCHSLKRCSDEEEDLFAELALSHDLQAVRKPDKSKPSSINFEDQQGRLTKSLVSENHDTPDRDESLEINCTSNRSSFYSLGAHLPKFPKPPDRHFLVFNESSPSYRASVGHELHASSSGESLSDVKVVRNSQKSEESLKLLLAMADEKSENVFKDFSAQLVSAREGRSRSNQSYSIDRGLNDRKIMIREMETTQCQIPNKDGPFQHSCLPSHQLDHAPQGTPYYPLISNHQPISLLHNSQPKFQRTENEGDPRNEHRDGIDQKLLVAIPNFSHQIRISPSQSNSPMLAPKPISPARELLLKNSIPLLMKALPPIPTRESLRTMSPPLTSILPALPFRFAPLIPDIHRHTSEDWTAPFQPQPIKFKLKPRSLASIGPLSLRSSYPWNLNESLHCTDQSPNTPLHSSVEDQRTAPRKSQKFKLRVMKASSSSFGTVRVNKAARNRSAVHGLDPRHPKDLFTTPAGLTDIFRQVSNHFVPRKTSGSGESILSSEHTSGRKMVPDNMHRPQQLSSVLFASQTAQPRLFAVPPTEVRSFFSDDSSQIEGYRGLRKRISNLRARIPVPQGSRPQERRSLDDAAHKRNTGGFNQARRQSRPNIMLASKREPSFSRERRQQLKKKVFGWLKDAQTTLKGCAKSRRREDELPSPLR